VHILRLPIALINEDFIWNIASKLGNVEKVKLEARNNSLCKIDEAKVSLNCSSPLKIGIVVDFGAKEMMARLYV